MPKVTDNDEIYQCQICLEMYDETKRKPMMFNKCQHNVCRVCLPFLIKKSHDIHFKDLIETNELISLDAKLNKCPIVICPYCKVEYKMNSSEILENQTTIKLIRSLSLQEFKTSLHKDPSKRRSTMPETCSLEKWNHNQYLKTLFDDADKNCDGNINVSEIHQALSRGLPNEVIKKKTVQLLVQNFDENHDSEINLKEFKDLFMFLNDEYVCFLLTDLDGDRKIDLKELHRFFKKRGFNFDKSFSNFIIETIKINSGEEILFDYFLRISVHFQYLIEQTKYYYSNEMVEKFLKNTFFDDFWIECNVNEPIIRKRFSSSGGEIKTPQIDLIVPPNAVKKDQLFIIKLASESLKKFEFIDSLSPIYELIPHSIQFNVPIRLIFKNIKNSNENICLYKLNNEEIDKLLNKWTIFFPKKRDNNFIEFELTSFSFAFLGSMDVGIDINCERIGFNDFSDRFQPYQFIKPGLNYRVECGNNDCVNKLIICNREYGDADASGNIRPIEDVAEMLRCSNCDTRIELATSIKALILFQVEGFIKYRLDATRHLTATVQRAHFRVNSNNIVIFGDGNLTERYEFFTIHVRKLEIENSKNLAGLSLETTQINLNLPNCFDDRRKGFVTVKADPYFKSSCNCLTNFDIEPEVNFPILNSERISAFFEIKLINPDELASLVFKIESGNSNDVPIEIISSELRNENLEIDENYCLYKLDNEENDYVLRKCSVYLRPRRRENSLAEFEIDLKSNARVFLGKFNLHFQKNPNPEDFRNYQIIEPGLNYIINCSRINCFGIQNIIIINKGSGTFRFDNECLPDIECSICKKRISSLNCFRAIVLFKVTGNIRYKLSSPGATQKVISYVATNDKLIVLGSFMGNQFSDFYIGVKKCN